MGKLIFKDEKIQLLINDPWNPRRASDTVIGKHLMKMDIGSLVLNSDEFRTAYDISDNQMDIIKKVGLKPHPWDGLTEDQVEEDLSQEDKLARIVCMTINEMLFDDAKDDIADIVAKICAPPPPPPTLQAPARGIL